MMCNFGQGKQKQNVKKSFALFFKLRKSAQQMELTLQNYNVC